MQLQKVFASAIRFKTLIAECVYQNNICKLNCNNGYVVNDQKVCISCEDNGQVNQRGVCKETCDKSFVNTDGICRKFRMNPSTNRIPTVVYGNNIKFGWKYKI